MPFLSKHINPLSGEVTYSSVSSIFTDIVEDVKNKLGFNVSFEFGNWLEFSKVVTENLQTQAYRNLVYPCVFIHSDIKESPDKYDRFSIVDIDVYIITQTKESYRTTQRLNEVYVKLYDIEGELINQIEKSRLISWYNHNYTGANKYYFGEESKDQNQLNEIVDAIHLELKGLKIKRYNDC